jgi:hypothetical protein
MRQITLIFFLTSVIFSRSASQQLPVIEVYTPQPDLDATLYTDSLIKTTKDYKLNGNVKLITETITTNQNLGVAGLLKTTRYEFLKNNKLTLYFEDTLKGLKNSNSIIERYSFDDTGEKLIEIISYSGKWQVSKTVRKFDINGFINQEVFEQFNASSYYSGNKDMFDYTLNYYWTANKDTVQLKYTYKTEKSPYQRHYDQLRSFVYKKRKIEKRNPQTDSISKTLTLDFWPFSGYKTYDAKGNVVKWLIADNEIKNSYNVDQLYEYKYNDRNELTDVSYSTSGMHGRNNFEVQHKYEIQYLEYDVKGNWTLKKVTGKDNSEYLYQRKIGYY